MISKKAAKVLNENEFDDNQIERLEPPRSGPTHQSMQEDVTDKSCKSAPRSSIVVRAISKASMQEVDVRIISKRDLLTTDIENIRDEITVYKMAIH